MFSRISHVLCGTMTPWGDFSRIKALDDGEWNTTRSDKRHVVDGVKQVAKAGRAIFTMVALNKFMTAVAAVT